MRNTEDVCLHTRTSCTLPLLFEVNFCDRNIRVDDCSVAAVLQIAKHVSHTTHHPQQCVQPRFTHMWHSIKWKRSSRPGRRSVTKSSQTSNSYRQPQIWYALKKTKLNLFHYKIKLKLHSTKYHTNCNIQASCLAITAQPVSDKQIEIHCTLIPVSSGPITCAYVYTRAFRKQMWRQHMIILV